MERGSFLLLEQGIASADLCYGHLKADVTGCVLVWDCSFMLLRTQDTLQGLSNKT